LNFQVLNITANSLLQNGFVFMVHTVFFGQSIFRKIIKIVATRGKEGKGGEGRERKGKGGEGKGWEEMYSSTTYF